MAKSAYQITAIRPDLAIIHFVEAKNRREADVLVAKLFPGHSCEVSRLG